MQHVSSLGARILRGTYRYHEIYTLSSREYLTNIVIVIIIKLNDFDLTHNADEDLLHCALALLVYCNRSCLCVGESVTAITRNCVHRSILIEDADTALKRMFNTGGIVYVCV